MPEIRQRCLGTSRFAATFTALLITLGAELAPRSAAAADLPNYLATLPPGSFTSAIPTLSDPTQTWELYLPTGFVPGRKWPVLILFDPRARGNLAAQLFRGAADELGWILASSNNTTSDGPGEPNARAINAMIPDVMKRLPVDERRIYAGGFSGGGVLAWTVGLKGRFLAGVISIGGRPATEHRSLVPQFALFAAAGEGDFNYQPTVELDRIAAKAGVPHRLELFPGPHSWCPPEVASRALVWLEILAMRDGRAALDAARVSRALAADLASAEALAGSGDLLASARRFQEVAETFRGLGQRNLVDGAALRAAELLASPAARGATKEAKSAERYEALAFRKIAEALARIRQSELPLSPGELRHLLSVDDALHRRDSVGTGKIARAAAVRALAAMKVQLSFYLLKELVAAGEYRKAVPALQVVADVFPEDASTLYNLACAQARSDAPEAALLALGRSLEHGLAQPLQMETDPDLVSLRSRPEYARLLERARALAAETAPN